MLGLGDIVIPGILVALMLRLDDHVRIGSLHLCPDGFRPGSLFWWFYYSDHQAAINILWQPLLHIFSVLLVPSLLCTYSNMLNQHFCILCQPVLELLSSLPLWPARSRNVYSVWCLLHNNDVIVTSSWRHQVRNIQYKHKKVAIWIQRRRGKRWRRRRRRR